MPNDIASCTETGLPSVDDVVRKQSTQFSAGGCWGRDRSTIPYVGWGDGEDAREIEGIVGTEI